MSFTFDGFDSWVRGNELWFLVDIIMIFFIKNVILHGMRCCIYFFAFFLVLCGWSVAAPAEDFKSFDYQKIRDGRQVVDISDMDYIQSKLRSYENKKKEEIVNNNDDQENRVDIESDFKGYSRIGDVRESDGGGFVDQLTEKVLQSEQVFNKKALTSEDFYISRDLGLSSRVVIGAGSSSENIRIYHGYESNFLDRLHEGIKENIGENEYENLVWTYGEIKAIDGWINSALAQYDFGDGPFFDKASYNIWGLDEQLNFLVIFDGGAKVPTYSESYGNGNWKKSDKSDGFLLQTEQDRSLDVQVQESKFFIILRYINIINVVYMFFIVMFILMVINIFRFFLRQKRADLRFYNGRGN